MKRWLHCTCRQKPQFTWVSLLLQTDIRPSEKQPGPDGVRAVQLYSGQGGDCTTAADKSLFHLNPQSRQHCEYGCSTSCRHVCPSYCPFCEYVSGSGKAKGMKSFNFNLRLLLPTVYGCIADTQRAFCLWNMQMHMHVSKQSAT